MKSVLVEMGLVENKVRTTFTKIRVDSDRNRTSSVRSINERIYSSGVNSGGGIVVIGAVIEGGVGTREVTNRTEFETTMRESK